MNNALTPDTTIALLKAAESQSGDAGKKVKNARQLEQIAEKAQEFESVFIAEMMKPMFDGISTDGEFGGGRGEEVFRGMLLQEYGKMLAGTGSLGIADSVKTELLKIQEMQHHDTSTDE